MTNLKFLYGRALLAVCLSVLVTGIEFLNTPTFEPTNLRSSEKHKSRTPTSSSPTSAPSKPYIAPSAPAESKDDKETSSSPTSVPSKPYVAPSAPAESKDDKETSSSSTLAPSPSKHKKSSHSPTAEPTVEPSKRVKKGRQPTLSPVEDARDSNEFASSSFPSSYPSAPSNAGNSGDSNWESGAADDLFSSSPLEAFLEKIELNYAFLVFALFLSCFCCLCYRFCCSSSNAAPKNQPYLPLRTEDEQVEWAAGARNASDGGYRDNSSSGRGRADRPGMELPLSATGKGNYKGLRR